jgi:hypothetical protein
MYCDGVNVPVFWRATVSVNDEPEYLLTLPPLDESIQDKVFLFRCHRFQFPMPMATDDQKNVFWTALLAELPAFLHFLLFELETPPDIADERYGVRSFLHPTLVEALGDLAPEQRLMELIDLGLFRHRIDPWEGTAAELQAELTRHDAPTTHEARRLFSYAGSVGHLLRALRQRHPAKISYRTVRGTGMWTLVPPDPH